MIFGECPRCSSPIVISVPDDIKLPVFSRETCESCSQHYWEKISRIDPKTYTDDEIIVDEDKRTVKLRSGVV